MHVALQIEIYGQAKVVAGLSVLAVQLLDLAPERVDLESDQTRLAA